MKRERERGESMCDIPSWSASWDSRRFEQSHILNYDMYIKMMPHGASDKDTANSQSCCLLLKKGNPRGYMVTQTVATLAGFSRCNFLTPCLHGVPTGMSIISEECPAPNVNTWDKKPLVTGMEVITWCHGHLPLLPLPASFLIFSWGRTHLEISR